MGLIYSTGKALGQKNHSFGNLPWRGQIGSRPPGSLVTGWAEIGAGRGLAASITRYNPGKALGKEGEEIWYITASHPPGLKRSCHLQFLVEETKAREWSPSKPRKARVQLKGRRYENGKQNNPGLLRAPAKMVFTKWNLPVQSGLKRMCVES